VGDSWINTEKRAEAEIMGWVGLSNGVSTRAGGVMGARADVGPGA
jgi:hypothetical protein